MRTTDQILECLLATKPELQCLVAGVTIDIELLEDVPFQSLESDRVVLSSSALLGPSAAVVVRHALEAAQLRRLPVRTSVCALLAARTAVRYACHGRGEAMDHLLLRVAGLGDDEVAHERLMAHWLALRPLYADSAIDDISAADIRQIEAAWALAPPAEEILCIGGDERLRVLSQTGKNKYGCATRPIPGLVEFSSCTATTVTQRGYAAAESTRRRLLAAALDGELSMCCAAEAASIREGLLHRYGLDDTVDAVLAASGTDASLVAAMLAGAMDTTRPVVTVLVSAAETGRGVPNAVNGCAFGETTAMGHRQLLGDPIAGVVPGMACEGIALRSNGRPRAVQAIDADVRRHIDRAVNAGCKVLLYAPHASKTGLTAPSRQEIGQLLQDYHPHVHVVVDACQGRIDASDVQDYVQAGATVLLTGSKFFTGPSFCGVVFAPRSKVQTVLDRMPVGLGAYSSIDDWRQAPSCLSHGHNVGLLLRWAAGLAEMDAFRLIPAPVQIQLLKKFGGILRNVFSEGPALMTGHPVQSPSRTETWAGLQTIFPFMLRSPFASDRVLSMSELECVYRSIHGDLARATGDARAATPCQIGQPVAFDGEISSGRAVLRFAASSRHVAAYAATPHLGEWAQRIEHEARMALHMIEKATQTMIPVLAEARAP